MKKDIHRTFYSEERMKEAIETLIEKSQWFQVLPHPNNEWLVFVKAENEQLLNTL